MTTYYVDATGGNDSNTGLSTATAWATMDKVNAATLNPGDWVLFKRGQHWHHQLTPVRDGAAGSMITYGAYGTGGRPIIYGNTVHMGALFVADGYHHLRFEHIDFSGSNGVNYSAVMSQSHDLYYYDCIFRDSQYAGLSGWTETGVGTYNVVIDSCQAYNNLHSGIMFTPTSDGLNHDIEIKNCIAHNNGDGPDLGYDPHGIYVRFGCTVHDCICYNQSKGAGIKANCEGIHSVNTPVVYNNYCYNNARGMEAVNDHGIFYNNLLVGNEINVQFDPDSHDIVFVFNTLVNAVSLYGESLGVKAIRVAGDFADAVIENNLIIQDWAACTLRRIWVSNTPGDLDNIATNNTIDYNVYYANGNPASDICYDVTDGYYSFTEWQAKTGSPDANSTLLTALPGVVARYTDLHPTTGGNIEGKGLAIVGYTHDKDGVDLTNPPTPGCYGTYYPIIIIPDSVEVLPTTKAYKLRLLDSAGVPQAELVDYGALTVVKRVNQAGLLRTTLRGDHAILATLTDKWQVELWRRTPTKAWYRFFGGLFRAQHYEGIPAVFQLTAPGYLGMLGWRVIAWAAGTANRSAFDGVKGETIANTLVKYNATASATVAAGRLREGAITGISVEADGAEGNTLDWFCMGANLLENLQKLALVAGGDYDLVKTAAATWEWRWYTGQLGTDRRATVKFSVENGNMGDPVYDYDRMEEASAVIVGGQGEGSQRVFTVREGTDYSLSANNIETFMDATFGATTEYYQSSGDKRLEELRARENFSFKVLQTPACALDEQYYLGDLVSVVNPFTGTVTTQKITGVGLTLGVDGSEKISVEVGTP